MQKYVVYALSSRSPLIDCIKNWRSHERSTIIGTIHQTADILYWNVHQQQDMKMQSTCIRHMREQRLLFLLANVHYERESFVPTYAIIETSSVTATVVCNIRNKRCFMHWYLTYHTTPFSNPTAENIIEKCLQQL